MPKNQETNEEQLADILLDDDDLGVVSDHPTDDEEFIDPNDAINAERENKPANKLLGKFTKNKKKKKKPSRRSSTYHAPIAGYEFTPSFIHIPGQDRYATIVKIENRYGMNRNQSYGWMTNLIPRIQKDGVKAYLFEADKPMDEKEQREIVDKYVKPNQLTQVNANNDDNMKDTNFDKQIRNQRAIDLDHVIAADGQDQRLIDSRLLILLIAKTPQLLTEQLERLQKAFDDNMKGIQLVSMGGSQQQLLDSLLQPPEKEDVNQTWTSSLYAGNDHMVRKGLQDRSGWVIGGLVESISQGTALMDMDRSFNSLDNFNRKGKVLIASSENSQVKNYSETAKASSLWAQFIANNVIAHGHRVFHIVLNNFHYEGSPRREQGKNGHYFTGEYINQILDKKDMSRGGINPLEMFGKIEDVVSIYNNSLSKIAMIFYLMSGRTLPNDSLQALRESLNNFYISKKLWTQDAARYPTRTRVMNINDHNKFPLMGTFIGELQNSVNRASNAMDGATDFERDRLKQLTRVLENSLREYGQVFNEPTSPYLTNKADRNYYQYYYNLGRMIANPNIQQAQFLNIFDYVTSIVEAGDVVIIHGMDRLSVDVIKHIKNRIDLLTDDKIRFVYCFDRITGEKEGKPSDPADIFNTGNNVLYQNLDLSFDYTILGHMTPDEFHQYEHALGTKLPPLIQALMAGEQNMPNYFQIRRRYDNTSNIIDASFRI